MLKNLLAKFASICLYFFFLVNIYDQSYLFMRFSYSCLIKHENFHHAHSDSTPTPLNDPILIIYLFENAYRMYTHIHLLSAFAVNNILPYYRNVGRFKLIPNDFLKKNQIFFFFFGWGISKHAMLKKFK